MKQKKDDVPIREEQAGGTPVRLQGTKRKKRTRPRVIVATVGSALLVLVGALVIVGGIYVNNLLSAVQQDPQTSDASYTPLPVLPSGATVAPEEIGLTERDYLAANIEEIEMRGNKNSVQNFLLIGTDKAAGLSDTTIILSINKQTHTITMASLLRDLLVVIPGYDYDHDGNDDAFKLNSAFASGGFGRLRKTIQRNFRLDIDKYVQVDFKGFSSVVDKMGGVDMELTEAEAKDMKVGKTAGKYHLNGDRALAYVRIRRIDNDFGRTNRQRKMLTTLFNQAKSMGLGKMNDVLFAALEQITTNLSKDEMTGLMISGLMEYTNYAIESYSIPHGPVGTDFVYDYVSRFGGKHSVEVLKDPTASVLELHEWLYGKKKEE